MPGCTCGGIATGSEIRASVLNSCILSFRFPRNFNFNKKVIIMWYTYTDTLSTAQLVRKGISTLRVVTYPQKCVPASRGKQTWIEISTEISDFAQKFRLSLKFQISRFQWNISDLDDKIWNQDFVTVGKTVTVKSFVTVRKTVTVQVLLPLVKPFHFQSFSMSK